MGPLGPLGCHWAPTTTTYLGGRLFQTQGEEDDEEGEEQEQGSLLGWWQHQSFFVFVNFVI
jgi:hypothetical protein